MKRTETITGVDIGSSAVRVVVGHEIDRERVQLIGVGESVSRGVSKGNIVDLEQTVTSLSEALEQAERMVGFPLSRAVVGVNSVSVKVIESQGVVAVSKPNGEVHESDIERAVDQSQAVATAPNYETIHVLPKYFNLDNQTNIKEPAGMTGIKLEAHTQIILALSSHVKNVQKCLNRTGLEMEGLVFSPIATAEGILSNRQKDLGVAVVNVGAGTVSLAVYEEGELLHAAILPIGCDHITSDLAIGLRTSIEVAERVKISEGYALAEKVSKRDEIDLAKYSTEEMPRTMMSRKEIAEIIQARLDEIFQMVNQELRSVGREGKLPAGIVLTGGGSKMAGIVDFVRDSVRLPVFVGQTDQMFTPIDRVKDPRMSTAVGLVYFAVKESEHHTALPGVAWAQGLLGTVMRRIRGFRS